MSHLEGSETTRPASVPEAASDATGQEGVRSRRDSLPALMYWTVALGYPIAFLVFWREGYSILFFLLGSWIEVFSGGHFPSLLERTSAQDWVAFFALFYISAVPILTAIYLFARRRGAVVLQLFWVFAYWLSDFSSPRWFYPLLLMVWLPTLVWLARVGQLRAGRRKNSISHEVFT